MLVEEHPGTKFMESPLEERVLFFMLQEQGSQFYTVLASMAGIYHTGTYASTETR